MIRWFGIPKCKHKFDYYKHAEPLRLVRVCVKCSQVQIMNTYKDNRYWSTLSSFTKVGAKNYIPSDLYE